jgi:hypothetical protein
MTPADEPTIEPTMRMLGRSAPAGQPSQGARTVHGGGRVVALRECSRWQTDPKWPSAI